MEYYLKHAVQKFIPGWRRNIDKGKDIEEQISLQEYSSLYGTGVELGVRDLKYWKEQYDRRFVSQDFSDTQYYVVRIKQTPEIMCSGATQPTTDFAGNALQDLGNSDQILDQLTLTILATDSGGVIIFSWIGQQKACSALLSSLNKLTHDQKISAIESFTFMYFENVFLSPDWWDSLDNDGRASLTDKWTSVFLNNDEERRVLFDDKKRLTSWEIDGIDTNISF